MTSFADCAVFSIVKVLRFSTSGLWPSENFLKYYLTVTIRGLPSRQNCGKSSAEECIFEYMALHFECRFNKNSVTKKCYFLAILPAGFVVFVFEH